jgi:hypothetical protein
MPAREMTKTEPEVDATEAPTAAEEEVLEELHTVAGQDRQPSRETMAKLHQDIERCECYLLFAQYDKGTVPSLDRMFANTQPILSVVRQEIALTQNPNDVLALQRSIDLISGREQAIRSAIGAYVRSVIRFQNLRRLSAGGARDVTRQFVDADHARRRAHNNLLDALTIYAQQVQTLAEEGFDTDPSFSFVRWTPDMDASAVPADKTVVFDASVMKNRNFIRDWAIVADFAEQLKQLEQAVQETDA